MRPTLLHFLFFFFAVSYLNTGLAKKDTTIVFCDIDLNKAKKKTAPYYMKVYAKGDGTVGFSQYKRNGALIMKGSFETKKRRVKTGDFTYYNYAGDISKIGRYSNNEKTGIWKFQNEEGIITAEGKYENDEREGKWIYHDDEGRKSGITHYASGKFHGEYLRWFKDTLITQGRYSYDEKQGEWKTWFPSGALDSEGAFETGSRVGEWRFYHLSGAVASIETYDNGETTEVKWFDEEGNAVTPGEVLFVEPSFVGGDNGMRNFIVKNISYPMTARENGEQGIVYIQFKVNPDGEISDAKILRGVSPSLDREALRMVRSMPKWVPGIDHNRKIPISFTLPISFRLG